MHLYVQERWPGNRKDDCQKLENGEEVLQLAATECLYIYGHDLLYRWSIERQISLMACNIMGGYIPLFLLHDPNVSLLFRFKDDLHFNVWFGRRKINKNKEGRAWWWLDQQLPRLLLRLTVEDGEFQNVSTYEYKQAYSDRGRFFKTSQGSVSALGLYLLLDVYSITGAGFLSPWNGVTFCWDWTIGCSKHQSRRRERGNCK